MTSVPVSETPKWKCMAPSKAACNWPDCGCDPAATNVIQALVDQGWMAPPEVRTSVHAQTPAESRERTYMRGWNEAAKECALLAERLGEEYASNASRVCMATEIAAAIRSLSDTSTDRKGDLPEAIKEYARNLRRNPSGGDDYPWELMRGVADALDEIINYSGGAESSLHDEYVVERARAALSAVTSTDREGK